MTLGLHQLEHRIALRPLPRMGGKRYRPDTSSLADYYSNRASQGGLVTVEGTHQLHETGKGGYVPGPWNKDQIKHWKTITDSIRRKGAISCCQLWYDICSSKEKAVYRKKDLLPEPVLATAAGISMMKESANAATNLAGFDMIQIHNLYQAPLLSALSTVVQEVADVIGPKRVGFRLAPLSDTEDVARQDRFKDYIPPIARILEQTPDLAFINLNGRLCNSDHDIISPTDVIDPFRQLIESHNEAKGSNVVLLLTGVPIAIVSEHAKQYPKELLAFSEKFHSNPGKTGVDPRLLELY